MSKSNYMVTLSYTVVKTETYLIQNETKENMEKAIVALQREVSKLRTGRASLNVLDDIRVNNYGQQAPLNEVATLGVPDSRMITVTPWDTGLLAEIEKAIVKANLGLSPSNDGKMIRLPIPALSEERRKELVKMLRNHGEDSKVSVRHVRRDSIDKIKKL